MLSVNADDWGRDTDTTDRILSCYLDRRLHSASAMVFARDSERAAQLAREHELPVGLHLNFTHELNFGTGKLKAQHRALSAYLNRNKINQLVFNPLLVRSFQYVFAAQWEEFARLYGSEPTRLDGHDHMHLCMNMLLRSPLQRGLKVRRNFTFRPGEKNPLNRLYRCLVDRWLSSRFRVADHFFSLIPIEQKRLAQILELASSTDIELMVHPGRDNEYGFLMSEDWAALISGVRSPDYSYVAGRG
jgi:chitin disaccharide deacetylase